MTARKRSSIDAIASDEGEPRLAPCPSRRRRLDLDWSRGEARCDLSRAYVHHQPVPQIARALRPRDPRYLTLAGPGGTRPRAPGARCACIFTPDGPSKIIPDHLGVSDLLRNSVPSHSSSGPLATSLTIPAWWTVAHAEPSIPVYHGGAR